MDISEVDPALAAVIADALGIEPDKIKAESGVDVTESWDSFGHLRVVLDVEFEYGVQFETSRIPELTTAKLIQQELDRLFPASGKS